MNRLLLIGALAAVALAAHAAEDVNPAVNTSAEPASSAPAATPVPAPAKGKGTRALAPTQGAQAAPAAKPSGPVELDPTQITGNRELPKVMYVVPWKRPSLGDYPGQPPNSLLDEVLSPVDRTYSSARTAISKPCSRMPSRLRQGQFSPGDRG